jgi:putative tryptophan/tyrosine transport system substrate-binding protein
LGLSLGGSSMRRRELIAVLGGVVAAWSIPSRAQQQMRIARIGYLSPNPRDSFPAFDAFTSELGQLGYRDGENLSIDFRALGDDIGDLLKATAELVQENVDVVVADGPEATLQAALRASKTVPIVILAVNYDPVARHYIMSLARPGGNVTGVVYRQPDLADKQLQLLREAVPGATRLAILWDAISGDQMDALERGAQAHNFTVTILKMEKPPYDFEAAFRTVATSMPQIVLVLSSPYFNRQRERIAALARQYRLPTMFTFQSYVDAGGLMFYGADTDALHRRAAHQVAKILRGAGPGDLPVEQPSYLKLVINLATAHAIGLTVPQSVVARADEVIE